MLSLSSLLEVDWHTFLKSWVFLQNLPCYSVVHIIYTHLNNMYLLIRWVVCGTLRPRQLNQEEILRASNKCFQIITYSFFIEWDVKYIENFL